MKKCIRCNIVFHLDERTRCLYCDALLHTVSRDDTGFGEKGEQNTARIFDFQRPVIEQLVDSRKGVEEPNQILNTQFMMGNYFRNRTFNFMYSFCRNEFKIGKKFRRPLVQPLHIASVLMLPWVVWDLIDSVLMRIFYTGYDEKCGWKYFKLGAAQEIDPERREYNKEYSALLENILTGKILFSEERFRQDAEFKKFEGKRSAYYDLCSKNTSFMKVVDLMVVWFSIAFLLFLIVSITLPYVWRLVSQLEI